MDSAEKLRERVDRIIVEGLARADAYAREPSQPEPDSDEYTERVLRAIVEELGLDRHEIQAALDLAWALHVKGSTKAGIVARNAEALSTLLHAAGFTPTEED